MSAAAKSSATARMVGVQIAGRGVRDRRVLDVMRDVPREKFVDRGFEEFAHEDSALPIGAGQTISQPYIVALMLEAAELRPSDKVLEVGAGSGYAAALMSRMAKRVHAIERQESLIAPALARFRDLGYDNIKLRGGDGTKGWPEAAPFDAIIVSAGGPHVPDALKKQLAPGGRLIIPVGENNKQQLLKLTRTGDNKFEEEELGGVRFVPLIGEQGWTEDGRRAASYHVSGTSKKQSLPGMIAAAAEPLPDFKDAAFGKMFDRFGDRRIVLLGEASHGTSEFYRARAAITRRLIEAHGFTIVAVEADWPDAAIIDRYVRHKAGKTGCSRSVPALPDLDVAEYGCS